MAPKNEQTPTDLAPPESPTTVVPSTNKTKPDSISEEAVAGAAKSLDQTPTSLEPTSPQTDSTKPNIFSSIETVTNDTDEKKPNRIIQYLKRLDKYILAFVLVLIAVSFLIFYIIQRNKAVNPVTAHSQSLTQATLSQLNANSVAIGSNQETLDIQSNTIFSSNALVKGALQVAGALTVANNTTLQNATISGSSQLNQVAGNSLTINGLTTLKGQLVVGQSLTVAGNTTLSGAVNAGKLTVSSLQVNGNISIDYHLVTNGLSPTIKSLGSGVIGTGGTVSINGTDTSGTININFGSGVSSSAACDASITFNQSFANTPSVIISPSNIGASNINYYVSNKTANGFEVCSSGASSTDANFDYFVID